MAAHLVWDDVTILRAIVLFFERESHWPRAQQFTRAHQLPTLTTVYQHFGTPADAIQWAFWSLVCDGPDDGPCTWQITPSDY